MNETIRSLGLLFAGVVVGAVVLVLGWMRVMRNPAQRHAFVRTYLQASGETIGDVLQTSGSPIPALKLPTKAEIEQMRAWSAQCEREHQALHIFAALMNGAAMSCPMLQIDPEKVAKASFEALAALEAETKSRRTVECPARLGHIVAAS